MTDVTSRRLSRRMLLTDFGAAGLGLVVLGACGGSSNGAAGTTTTSTTPSEASPGTSPDPDAVPTGDLRLQHVPLGIVSAYVLLRGSEAAVVDTGQSQSAPAILEGLGLLGAEWSDVGHVVLTHRHGDHVGGLSGVLEEAPGATVYAGEADLDGITSSAPVRSVGDGDEVLGMGVLNTPGHTPGSISLFDTASGILVAGDAINGDDGRLAGANPDFSSDMTAASASVGKLAALSPLVAAFGHGGPPISDDVAAQLDALASA